MDRPEVERILRDADRRLAKGELVDLRLGFWRNASRTTAHDSGPV